MSVVYMFWFGDNMSDDRKRCFEQFKKISETKVILITYKNLNNYILDSEPLHPAFKYLSYTHQADYLRTYFMNFYGGGYSDIKMTTGSWKKSFDDLYNSDKWINGYQEIGYNGVAVNYLKSNWYELIGNAAYICKPQTNLTKEWYNEMLLLLDNKLEKLKKYPAIHPQDCAEVSRGKYPIEWNEMLGRIFHRICYKYKNKLLKTLPTSIFKNYR